MKGYAEEETKDGRHFPTDSESQILIHHLQIYFSHPERSMQRSQVVQSVVSLLSPTNKHWTQRTVRLWFNNNKKVYYRPTSPANPDAGMEPPRPFRQPQRNFFQPVRSQSVMSLNCVVDREEEARARAHHYQPQALLPRQPKLGPLAMAIAGEYDLIQNRRPPEESEARIQQKVAEVFEAKWQQTVLNDPAPSSIQDDIATVPHGIMKHSMKTTPLFQQVIPYEYIEASMITPSGDPMVIAYDMSTCSQIMSYNGMTVDVELSTPVSAVAYDLMNDVFWLHAGDVVKGFHGKTLAPVQILSTGKKCRRSAMVFCKQNQNLIVASESTIWRWAQTAMGPDPNAVSLTLLIPAITSLATVSEALVVASSEYHTAQVYAQNGATVARIIGHRAGITALHGYDENCFLSGSADETVKLWDLRAPHPAIDMVRHRGVVTSLYGDGTAGHSLVLTGGTDGMMKGWDVRNIEHLFSMSTGQSPLQSLHYSHAGHRITAVVSERVADSYYDLEKFTAGLEGPIANTPPNAVLTYSYS